MERYIWFIYFRRFHGKTQHQHSRFKGMIEPEAVAEKPDVREVLAGVAGAAAPRLRHSRKTTDGATILQQRRLQQRHG